MTERVTIAVGWVEQLYCKNPSYSSDTDIGVGLPQGGTLIEKKLEVLNENARIWTVPTPQWPPNLNVEEMEYPAGEDRQFKGWRIRNRDENLPCWLKGTFRWNGEGPDVIQSFVGSIHACTDRPPSRDPHAVDLVKIGFFIALPNAARVLDYHCHTRDGQGPWTGALVDHLSWFWTTEGGACPEVPGYNAWGVSVTNTDQARARGIRIKLQRA
jgi:hypothetical protein